MLAVQTRAGTAPRWPNAAPDGASCCRDGSIPTGKPVPARLTGSLRFCCTGGDAARLAFGRDASSSGTVTSKRSPVRITSFGWHAGKNARSGQGRARPFRIKFSLIAPREVSACVIAAAGVPPSATITCSARRRKPGVASWSWRSLLERSDRRGGVALLDQTAAPTVPAPACGRAGRVRRSHRAARWRSATGRSAPGHDHAAQDGKIAVAGGQACIGRNRFQRGKCCRAVAGPDRSASSSPSTPLRCPGADTAASAVSRAAASS